jgi:hypothetical protein
VRQQKWFSNSELNFCRREKEFVPWRCRHDQMEWELCAIPGLEASPLDSTVAGLSF